MSATAAPKPGFFRETNKKILTDQRRRAQNWFREHPTTFFLAWGAKGLTFNVPRAVFFKAPRAIHRGMMTETTWEKAWNDRERDAAAETTEAVIEPDAVIMNSGGGTTVIKTTTTTNAGGTALTQVQRVNILDTGRNLLTTSPQGQAFSMLAGEFEVFSPVKNFEATSTLFLFSEASIGFGYMESGLDSWSDVIEQCWVNYKVVNQVNHAVEHVGAAADAFKRAARKVEDMHGLELDQEESGNGKIKSVPAVIDTSGGEPTGVKAAAGRVGSLYTVFEPVEGSAATSVLQYIKAAQAGLSMTALSVDSMSRRLRKHKINVAVRDRASAAGSSLVKASASLADARRLMMRLHGPHIQAERTGVPFIGAGRVTGLG